MADSKLRVLLKSRVADKVLLPVREELTDRIPPGSTVLDIGCGTGDLLFRSALKLSRGWGVDIDKAMITFAEQRRARENISNIEFICSDIRETENNDYDIATSTLCLHETGIDTACEILELMINRSGRVLIADFTSASTLTGKVGIEMDEMFSGHYRNFRKYKKSGEIPYCAKQVGARITETVSTEIDGISIWVIEGKGGHDKSR